MSFSLYLFLIALLRYIIHIPQNSPILNIQLNGFYYVQSYVTWRTNFIIFISFKRNSVPTSRYYAFSPPLSPRQPLIYFLLLLFQKFLINWIIQYVLLCLVLVFIIWHKLFEVHPCCNTYQYSIYFYRWIIFHCTDMPHFFLSIHQLMDIWVLPTLCYYEKCCCEHLCTNLCMGICFLLGI